MRGTGENMDGDVELYSTGRAQEKDERSCERVVLWGRGRFVSSVAICGEAI